MRFLLRELRHGFPQALIDDPVIGIGQNWLESALDFVLPLRARVEARQSRLNAVLYAAVIAGLEMQELKFCEAAPVAPVQGVIPFKKKRDAATGCWSRSAMTMTGTCPNAGQVSVKNLSVR